MTGSILYITVDGVLQQLGYSQVGRVVMGLARRGFRYHLLSLESPADLADAARVRELQQRFRDHGVEWSSLPYDRRGNALAAGSNLLRVVNQARKLVAAHGIKLLHARGYHSAMVSLALRRTLGVPYLFDARGRWIDERLLGGRWFTNPMVERGARAVERQLYENAAAHVVLTELHGQDIVAGDFGKYRGAPIRVITTCADFGAFTLQRRQGPPPPSIPADVAQRLAGKLVLAFVGSTNAFYRHDIAFEVARLVLERAPQAHLLILSAQTKEFAKLVEASGLPRERVSIASAAHEAMPDWLSRIDWAFQILNGGVAKRGSMPTKLAEFLAAGVRPIHFGCNDEVSSWVERTGSGLVLQDLGQAELARAAGVIANAHGDFELLQSARERGAPHFDLAAGLNSYEKLLGELGQHTR